MIINYQNVTDEKRLSKHTKDVIALCAEAAGIDHVTVTSASRTPQAQARAMYANCIAGGFTAQLKLYGAKGDEVIRVAEQLSHAGKSPSVVIDAMTAKIEELGPATISRHCQTDEDFRACNVLDMSASRIPHDLHKAFEAAIQALEQDGVISKHFSPYTDHVDPAFHIEVPQPTT